MATLKFQLILKLQISVLETSGLKELKLKEGQDQNL